MLFDSGTSMGLKGGKASRLDDAKPSEGVGEHRTSEPPA